ncbi:variable surface protein [Plasmodium gonderi]|uniref:Variable surface protein n=1 Tax=Plasmodium gonderi TaxID=77519 RepID=A0A1Y1JN01_PLAGO|nr:variable surface protein [Plasmodium gonderi]GAW83966.1 variable surface protein [Plasmodium gonderi]
MNEDLYIKIGKLYSAYDYYETLLISAEHNIAFESLYIYFNPITAIYKELLETTHREKEIYGEIINVTNAKNMKNFIPIVTTAFITIIILIISFYLYMFTPYGMHILHLIRRIKKNIEEYGYQDTSISNA